MYKIILFIPAQHKEKVKMSMFEAGGGKIGNYDCCSFETEGTGQFRPLDGSKPFIGQTGKIEKVNEVRVEMVCADDNLRPTLKAMFDAHPYETPAYDVIKLEDISI